LSIYVVIIIYDGSSYNKVSNGSVCGILRFYIYYIAIDKYQGESTASYNNLYLGFSKCSAGAPLYVI
jgi:hypothetical protein